MTLCSCSLSDAVLAERYQSGFSSVAAADTSLIYQAADSSRRSDSVTGVRLIQIELGFALTDGRAGSVWRCKSKEGPSLGGTVSIKLVHRSKNPTSSARVRSLWQEFK